MSGPKPTERCIIHYESVESLTELVQLRDLESWTNLLKAAKIRAYSPLTGIATKEDEFPKVSYHATCRSSFTMKRDLNALTTKSKDNQNTQSIVRQSIRLLQSITLRECGKLERKCIFCNKEKKYVKRKLDSFFPITEMRACKTLLDASEMRNDDRLRALCSEDLIAKEAFYHKTCYKEYTRILTKTEHTEESYIDKAFEEVKEYCYSVRKHPEVVELIYLTNILEKALLKENNTDQNKFAKKNLRKRIERNLPWMNFVTFENRKVLLYPDSLSADILVEKYFRLKQEINKLQEVADKEQMLMKAATIIRKDILIMEDNMPCPPQPADLTDDKIPVPESLSTFMNILLSGKHTPCRTTRGIRLKLSICKYWYTQLFSPI